MMKGDSQGFGWFAFVSCVSDIEKGQGDEFEEGGGQMQLPTDEAACCIHCAPASSNWN